jgi:hypothetical protein
VGVGRQSTMGRRTGLLWRNTLGLALRFSAAAGSLSAQASVYVRLSDPAYADLEVLIALGWVQGVMVGEGPHSEAAFRRFVHEGEGGSEGRARSHARCSTVVRGRARTLGRGAPAPGRHPGRHPGGGPSVEAVCRGRSRGCASPRLPGICGGQLPVRPRVRGQQRGRVGPILATIILHLGLRAADLPSIV